MRETVFFLKNKFSRLGNLSKFDSLNCGLVKIFRINYEESRKIGILETRFERIQKKSFYET